MRLFLPAELSSFEHQHLRRMNRVALGFFVIHLPVMVAVAAMAGTGMVRAILYTGLALVGPVLAYRTFQSPRNVSMVFGLTAMCMGGLLVHFGQGAMQIEMHFYFFVLLALLVVFANPLVIIAAAVTVALHHLVLYFVIPTSVFNYDASLWAVAVHAGFVALETIAACFVARSFFDNVVGLEKIVAARTEELRRHEALVAETRVRNARMAGMAEVATGVLHNVGNALNSVGVAASMASDMVRRSKLPGLVKTNALIAANAADVAGFFASHPQGKQLPAYLAKLTPQLMQEREEVLSELERLQKGIAHMTAIVGTQQSLAKAGRGGGQEQVKPAAVFDEALQLALTPDERKGLSLTIETGDLAPMPLDRHRLIQILVNLIRNASQAVAATPGEKQVRLSIAADGARIRFEVRDNGSGIDAEHKVKIFAHGFTTRTNGHGFGLHASACAAMEMGGTLTCDSAGPGLGSAFTVDLPCTRIPPIQEAA